MELIGMKTREAVRATFHQAAKNYELCEPMAHGGHPGVASIIEHICSEESVSDAFFAGELQIHTDEFAAVMASSL